jgi:hypothetical protein
VWAFGFAVNATREGVRDTGVRRGGIGERGCWEAPGKVRFSFRSDSSLLSVNVDAAADDDAFRDSSQDGEEIGGAMTAAPVLGVLMCCMTRSNSFHPTF